MKDNKEEPISITNHCHIIPLDESTKTVVHKGNKVIEYDEDGNIIKKEL